MHDLFYRFDLSSAKDVASILDRQDLFVNIISKRKRKRGKVSEVNGFLKRPEASYNWGSTKD